MAVSVDKKFVPAYNNIGNLLYTQKKYEEAVDYYDKAIMLNPEYGVAYMNRGICKEMLRLPEEACEDWTKALSLGIKKADTYIKSQCN